MITALLGFAMLSPMVHPESEQGGRGTAESRPKIPFQLTETTFILLPRARVRFRWTRAQSACDIYRTVIIQDIPFLTLESLC